MPEEVRANSGKAEVARGRPHTDERPTNPEDFCKNKSSVREKMTDEMIHMSPEERLRRGNGQ